MNKKVIMISIVALFIFSSICTISATLPTKNHYNSAPCYACNSTECYCNDTCLCKNPDYENIINGDNKIRNNDSCYKCNETCYCPDTCSCKQPTETWYQKTFKPVTQVFQKIYVIIINPIEPKNNTNNTTPDNTTTIKNITNTTNNTTIKNNTEDTGTPNELTSSKNTKTKSNKEDINNSESNSTSVSDAVK